MSSGALALTTSALPGVLASCLDELADAGPPSLAALARDLGLPHETLRRLWNGAAPSWETLKRLRAAGVSVDAVLDWELDEGLMAVVPLPVPTVPGLAGGIARAVTMTRLERIHAAWLRHHPRQEGQLDLPLMWRTG